VTKEKAVETTIAFSSANDHSRTWCTVANVFYIFATHMEKTFCTSPYVWKSLMMTKTNIPSGKVIKIL